MSLSFPKGDKKIRHGRPWVTKVPISKYKVGLEPVTSSLGTVINPATYKPSPPPQLVPAFLPATSYALQPNQARSPTTTCDLLLAPPTESLSPPVSLRRANLIPLQKSDKTSIFSPSPAFSQIHSSHLESTRVFRYEPSPEEQDRRQGKPPPLRGIPSIPPETDDFDPSRS